MIRSMKKIIGYKLEALDDNFGKVSDFLIDEKLWTTRYLVADTGGWLTNRTVILPKSVLNQPHWEEKIIPVKLTKEQVKGSPSLDSDAPVSRQHEIKLHKYWGAKPYWVGGITAGVYPIPAEFDIRRDAENEHESEDQADPFLRSVSEVKGYIINAEDGEIGQVDDFLFDDDTWTIRYLVVNTEKWLPGRNVMVPLHWITAISWGDNSVKMNATREQIKDCPDFNPSELIDREHEEILTDKYDIPKYWKL